MLSNCLLFLLRTNQEDGQLELVIEHHSMNAAGSAEPGCDFIQKVSVEDEEEDARAWSGREGGTWERKRRNDLKKKKVRKVLQCCLNVVGSKPQG